MLDAGKDLNVAGNMLAHGTIRATANDIQTGVIVSGMDIAASQMAAGGSLVLNKRGQLVLSSRKGIKTGQLVSGSNISAFAAGDIIYDSLVCHGFVDLQSEHGAISLHNRTAAAGDITLTATVLDLSGNQANLQTAHNLNLNADSIDVSNSELIYGGIVLNSNSALTARNASLLAVMQHGGSGNISMTVPAFTADKNTVVVAANNLTVNTNGLDNSGQLAAGRDLLVKVSGDVVNRETGLIYAGGDGSLLTGGNFFNESGAIIAQGDLLFADEGGAGKSLSLTNKAGLIQAGGALTVRTGHLTNEADKTPVISSAHEEERTGFAKPEHYDELGKYQSGQLGVMFHDTKYDRWGAGRSKTRKPVAGVGWGTKYYFEEALWDDRAATNGTTVLADGTVYKAFTWIFRSYKSKYDVELYDWDAAASMRQKTVTQSFVKKTDPSGPDPGNRQHGY